VSILEYVLRTLRFAWSDVEVFILYESGHLASPDASTLMSNPMDAVLFTWNLKCLYASTVVEMSVAGTLFMKRLNAMLNIWT
jgi:hypothetical protein